MSLAMDVLREQWRDAYRRYDADMRVVSHHLNASSDNLFYAFAKRDRMHMRKTAAEIVRLKKLEARVAELEAENAALEARACLAREDAEWEMRCELTEMEAKELD